VVSGASKGSAPKPDRNSVASRTSFGSDNNGGLAAPMPGVGSASGSGSFNKTTPRPLSSVRFGGGATASTDEQEMSLRLPGASDDSLAVGSRRSARRSIGDEPPPGLGNKRLAGKSLERTSVDHGSADRRESSDGGGAADDMESSERVWISDIGHVALFCSPTFNAVLSKRILLAGGSENSALATDRISRVSAPLDSERGGNMRQPSDSRWKRNVLNAGGGSASPGNTRGVVAFLDRVRPTRASARKAPLPARWGQLLATPTLQQAARVSSQPPARPSQAAIAAPPEPPSLRVATLSAANLARMGTGASERSSVADDDYRTSAARNSSNELVSRPGGFGTITLPLPAGTTGVGSTILENSTRSSARGITLATPKQLAPANEPAHAAEKRSIVARFASLRSRQPSGQGLARSSNLQARLPASPPRLRRLLLSTDGSGSGHPSRLSNAVRATKVIAALSRTGSAPNVAAALTLSLETAAANREAVAPAAELLEGLWSVFNVGGNGAVQVKEIRALQTSLGEMGGLEIKSLLRHLAVASVGLATAIERVASLNFAAEFSSSPKARMPGAVQSGSGLSWRGDPDDSPRLRKTRMLSRLEFAAGAIEWVRASAMRDDGDEDVDSFASPNRGDARNESGGDEGAHGAAAAGGAMPKLKLVGVQGSEQQRKQRGAPDTKGPDDDADVRSADGSARAEKPAVDERMRAVLSSDGFVNAFADAVQLRIDSTRLRRDDPVDSSALVAIFLNSVAIEPSLVRRLGLESWCGAGRETRRAGEA
jgi:hypothetical protein